MPSTPVEILGFADGPEAGEQFQVVADENKARQMVAYRQEKTRATHLAGYGTRMSLDDLFSRIEEGEVKELALIIKGDVRGSVEALSDALNQLSTDKVKVDIILAQPGAINESDVLLAATTSAIIIGFNVRAQKSAEKLAEKEGVEIRTYNIIYEATKDIHDAMRGLVEPKFREEIIGKAEVRQTFKVPKIGVVAGLYVTEGTLKRNAGVRVIRDEIVIHEGKVASLKRFKEDVREVKNGFECGLGIENFKDIREGDIIEMFVKEEMAVEL
jgi:translation initiation factor IF-2